ncbi:MAG: amino acid ABC transporter substrate-binding protein [Proteobacteria bacterium]|nr:MAG: amino acid ABC transporter substrate-binding protein [Pseudomonadota bacterium]
MALVAVASAAVLGCTKKEAGNEIKIGVMGPFTGGSAPMGVSMRNGVEIAIDQINAGGGIGGKKLVMVARDDEAKNERGGQIMQELIDKEGVKAVLGPINTGVANAASRYANEKKIPMIINVSEGARVNELFAESKENYVFHFAANADVQSEMMVNEALTIGKFKKPAVLCDDTNYGQTGKEKLEARLKTAGVTPVYVGKFKIKDTDMTAQLQQAKAAGADIILAYGIGPELAAVSNSMERVGWKVPMITSWTSAMSNYVNNAAKNGNGTMMPQTFIETTPKNETAKKFIVDYRAKFKEEPMASAVSAAQGYDSMMVLKHAIEQAGGVEGAKVKAALEALNATMEGVTGSYTKPFSTTDHEAVKPANTQMGVVKDGRVIGKDAPAAPASSPAAGM